MARKKSWAELSSTQKGVVVVAGAVEVVMTVAAWRDLATRPASTVRGPKPAWALAVLVQPVGPLAYFALGRR
jgi:Phospholipase_D-nuclease N-terminal